MHSLFRSSLEVAETQKFDGIFFAEVSKKNEKLLYQMKVGIKFGKVKKFGIGWCIPYIVVADKAAGGSGPGARGPADV